MTQDKSDKMPVEEQGSFQAVTMFENEYAALFCYDDGFEGRTSYLTRDFLEAVKDELPVYRDAAEALATEVLNSFAHAVMNTAEEEFLCYRPMDNMHSFAFSSSPNNPPPIGATEYLLTQSEIDELYDQANGQITEWLDLGMFESDRAKKAANHNLALLSARASVENGPL